MKCVGSFDDTSKPLEGVSFTNSERNYTLMRVFAQDTRGSSKSQALASEQASPLQPKLLTAGLASDASLERAAALGNGQLARRFIDFWLSRLAFSFFGLGDR